MFLGDTCQSTDWRKNLIPNLRIDYFNPLVDDWTEEAQKQELLERDSCDYVLYYITPEIAGVYSIAEVTDDSNKRPEKTVFCFDGDFDPKMEKSLKAVGGLVRRNDRK